MNFQSFEFISFFIAVCLVYWVIKNVKAQNIFLLATSYFFYGYLHYWFLALLFISTAVSFFAGRFIYNSMKYKKLWLAIGIIINTGILAIFKYFNFFIESFNKLLSIMQLPQTDLTLKILLPLGISFYTFQTIGYCFDIYRGKIKPCNNLITFSLFNAFFPKLVAGPIERAGMLIPQIEKKRSLTWLDFRYGILMVLWGYLLKMVVAGNAAIIVNKIFLLENPSFPLLWTGVLAFSIQILGDFAGYSILALGLARLLGFNLSNNFNNPYFSHSPTEFWRRWHITLSSWLRDYIYISLGGSRVSKIRTYFNILITFLVSGLWHGAAFNFILWGFYWGCIMMGHKFISGYTKKLQDNILYRTLSIILTFIIINIGWIFFKEENIFFIKKYLLLNPFNAALLDWRISMYLMATVIILYIIVFGEKIIESVGKYLIKYSRLRIFLEYQLIWILLLGIIFFHSQISADFIYFAF